MQTWSTLASLTLSRIILFNKRRSGEASKMTLSQYESKPNWQDASLQELTNSLTAFETKLASSLTMIEIVGKIGRKVPVILTRSMKECVDLIVEKRTEAGVSSDNKYIFARSGALNSNIRGHDSLKNWYQEAELESPENITSTKLRKYVATVSQIFNLTENEYDWLARHLGHDMRVHREFYRLQESTVELTKVSRLLLAVDQGQAHAFKGKSLGDINLNGMDTICGNCTNICM